VLGVLWSAGCVDVCWVCCGLLGVSMCAGCVVVSECVDVCWVFFGLLGVSMCAGCVDVCRVC